jgi:gluconate 5-dehydrogenase
MELKMDAGLENFSLKGRRAVVTGGSRGIGLGIARGMARVGADVVLAARTREHLDRAADDLRAETGVRVDVYAVDLTQPASVEKACRELFSGENAPDILVNNAGVNRRGPAEEISVEDWDAVLDLNLKAMFLLSQAFARALMATERPGAIINIASLLSEGARPTTAPYAASKGGVKLLTKSLALEWAPRGIRVNAIGPGYITTPMTDSLQDDPQFNSWVLDKTPMGRWGTPDDLAGAAVFLASDAAAFVTGQTLHVDGGWLACI